MILSALSRATRISYRGRVAWFSSHSAPSSVWTFRNWSEAKDGAVPIRKRITILGGIHGNEKVGISVVERLVSVLSADVGSILVNPDTELTLALGNLTAIEQNQRATTPAADLNRAFSSASLYGALLSENEEGFYEQQRARELAPILKACDVLIDIHATNKPSEPFVRIPGCCTHEHLHLASWFRNVAADTEEEGPTKLKLLLDPYMCLAGDAVTTDEFVNKCGGVSVCLETGLAQDESAVDEYYNRFVTFLQYESGGSIQVGDETVEDVQVMWGPYGRRLLQGRSDDGGLHPELRLDLNYNIAFEPYTLRERVMLKSENVEWSKGFGNRNWERVRKGQALLAQDGHEYQAKEDSVILFPKVKGLCVVDKPVCWLARRVDLPVKPFHARTQSHKTSKPAEGESVIEWFDRSQADIKQANAEEFLLFLYETPGRYRKNSSMPWRIISPTNAAEPDFSVDSGNPFTKVELSRLNPATAVPVARRSDPFGEALKEYLETKDSSSRSRGKRVYPNRASKLFLHFDESLKEPILIYPRIYSEHGTFFARSEEPYTSPRLTIPFTMERALRGKQLFLGIGWGDLGDLSKEEVAKQFQPLAPFLELELEHDRCLYVSFAPLGDAHTLYDDSIGKYSPNVFVRGSFKEDVGDTYIALSRAVLFLSSLTKTSVKEVHPTFTKEGFVMKEMGVVRTPSVQLPKVKPPL